MSKTLPVLGWKEQVALPDLGIRRLRAKLDTGARTSALHVDGLETVAMYEHDGEELPVLSFDVVLGRGHDARRKTVRAHAITFRTVRDTRAREEVRPVVRTRVVCGPLDRDVDVTVTDRTGMNFRMILGRTALAGVCLVDPEHGYRFTPHPRRRAPLET